MTGIVKSESRVDSDTRFTERLVAFLNLYENIVVDAATGEEALIAVDTNKSPLMPIR